MGRIFLPISFKILQMGTMMNSGNFLIPIVLTAYLLAASYTDLTSHRIPNLLILSGIGSALLINILLEGMPGLSNSLYGLLLGFLLLLPLYLLKGMAAGDIKLMATVGAFVGPKLIIAAVLSTLICGSIFGLVYIFAKNMDVGNRFITGINSYFVKNKHVDDNGSLSTANSFPYAPAIFAGTSVAILINSF